MEQEEISLYDLLYKLDHTKINRCEAIDPLLAERINDYYTVDSLNYHLNNPNLVEKFPLTKEKISKIIEESIKQDIPMDAWRLSGIGLWLNPSLENKIAKKYQNNESWDFWILERVSNLEEDTLLSLFNKYLDKYTKSKSGYVIQKIDKIFRNLKSNTEECASKLFEGTPALAACLLSRNDLEEKYVVKGLKSLSKLSRQRSTEVKIDFLMLKNLGPKSRLEAIKQLLGMNLGYSDSSKGLPFKETPSLEDVQEFLFPCSIKYNEEVIRVIERYKIIMESNNAKT